MRKRETSNQVIFLGALSVVLAACSGDDGGSGSGSASASATGTATATDGTGSTGAGPASATATGTSQGSDSASSGTTTDGTATQGTATQGTATQGSATQGTATDGTATATAGSDTGTAGTSASTGATAGSSGGVTPECGNGLLEQGEECDDGNNIDNDACSNTCTKVPCDQQMAPDTFDFSYIWISNSPAGTVSKIDTATATEVARYVSGPPGKQDPSRTSVSVDGRFAVVVNRNGSISMFAAEEDDCVDKNNNNQIDTSTGPGDVRPWGEDECLIWSVDLPSFSNNQGPRPVSWNVGEQDPNTCQYAMGDVWVGWYNQGQNTGYFRLLNGEDGATITEVSVPNWSGMNWGPYGGAVDGNNNFWVTGWGSNGPVVKIDGQTYQATHYGSAGGWIYGMGLDLQGNTWASGCGSGNVYRFDAQNETWSQVASVNASCLRGLQVDREGRAFIAKNGPCGLAVIDTMNLTVISPHVDIPGCSTPVGVSIDAEGYVWVVDQGASRAFKVDPDTYAVVATVTGLQSPYTYSDMTGAGLNAQILPQ
ncbi:MAG: hypothetical protein D6705_16320 [Deltaproteobacteria bacterium]|nr:MAG: hypothetical protein D6705_16320 [Deltaproteobacteria bacterium]